MGRKKPFIEKGEGVKFFLVHRSQKDPLYLDENLGEHVLVPADPDTNRTLVESVNGLNSTSQTKSESEKEALKRKRLEEQQKFGIYYEDDYNYLQHLREVDEQDKVEMEKQTQKIGSILIKNEESEDEHEAKEPTKGQKLQLPSSVFASNYEEDVGYFNQAAPDHDPKINWDPDIVKMLDEDEDIDFDDKDNEFEDDFFIKANSDVKTTNTNKSIHKEKHRDEDDEEEEDENEDTETEEDETSETDSDGSCKRERYDSFEERESVRDFETKSKFTNYSMSSIATKRNENLRDLDDHFEKLFSEYNEDQIGSLDTEEIDGYRLSNDLVLEQALSEFTELNRKKLYEPETRNRKLNVLVEKSENEDSVSEEEEEDDTLSENSENENKKEYETLRFSQKKDKDDRFDCESIISTYSTLYNHPSVISEKTEKKQLKMQVNGTIMLSKKTGLPLGVLADKPKSQKQLDSIDHKITKIMPDIPTRNKDETKEEKKIRKAAVKEHRKIRRVEKKINKLAFKHEKAIQLKQTANSQSEIIKLPL